jgi:UDP-N-acetylmuramyl pentapeptide phosphotransferase/UDP-N-acetylglucosamine-1-phosphate transferase
MTLSLLITFCAFLFSLVGTRVLILAFRDRRILVDIPNARSNHTAAIPRVGGLAVLTAIMIAMNIIELDYTILLPVIILSAISFLDDLITLPFWVRLPVHMVAVAIPLSFMPIHCPFLSPLMLKILIGAAWVWFINLFNFMDGIDGLSASEMISIGLGLTFVLVFADQFETTLSSDAMILAAAGCGFLWWNWHPAKIFLGDVGSIPIGFVTGYILLIAALNDYGFAALILPAYYLCDATFTILKRLVKGKKIWEAHSEHIYQKAMRNGRKPSVVVRFIVGLNILLAFLAVYTVILPDWAVVFVGLAYASVFMLMGYLNHTHGQHDPGIFI